MQRQRKLWPLVGLGSALILSVPMVGSGQSYEGELERGDRLASRSYVYQDFSSNEFFTQADRDLITRVRTALEDDAKTVDLVKNITISVDHERVVLHGYIPTEHDHERLISRVQRTVGVAGVQDDLRITGSAAAAPRDRVTGTRGSETRATVSSSSTLSRTGRGVEEKPAREGSFPSTRPQGMRVSEEQPSIGSGNMQEEDRTGTTGPSGTRSMSSLNTGAIDAIGRAAKSAGDDAVTENDRALVSQVRTALRGRFNLNPAKDTLHLKADNGTVYLYGWVATEQERAAMAETVRDIGGVQEVVNNLQVRPGTLGAVR